MSDAWARAAIGRAQNRIPGYRPQASVQETIEGEIDKNEADARDAEAALAAVGGQARPPAETLDNVCRPNGSLLGSRQKGSDDDVRTVTTSEFEDLLRKLTNDAKEINPSDPTYQGAWFGRADGTVIGVRRSNRYGLTIDIIDSQGNPALSPGTRINQK